MRRNANIISTAYFAFFVMIIFSSTLTGILSEAVFYLAYILPLSAATFAKGEKPKAEDFLLQKKSARLFLPMVFPCVLSIILLSSLTSALIFFFSGKTAAVNIGDNLPMALLSHALVPAILEELLFRYLPLKYLAPHSGRYAVFFSAIAFALVHHSFFSIPYALFAGAVFMTLDLLCESLLPSVIIHFINNAISVLWTLCFTGKDDSAVIISALAALTAVSLIAAFLMRREYAREVKAIFSEKCKFLFPISLVCLTVLTLCAAVFELII